MAVTYNIEYLPKKGFGVYLQSVSNYSLAVLSARGNIRNVFLDNDTQSETFGHIMYSPDFSNLFCQLSYITTDGDGANAVKLNGSRLALFPTKERAEKYVAKLRKQSEAEQVKLLTKKRFWVVDKYFKMVKATYYKVEGTLGFRGKNEVIVSSKSTPNKNNILLEYKQLSDIGLNPRIVKTVNRGLVVPTRIKIANDAIDETPYKAAGIVGMLKPIKDQGTKHDGGEFSQRIKQGRKKTTGSRFWSDK